MVRSGLTPSWGSRTIGFEPIIRLPIMRTKVFVLIVILLSLSGLRVTLAAQSLADVARQEQERRKAIKKPSKVLTNKDLGTVPGSAAPAAGAPAAGGTTPPPAGTDAAKPGANGAEKKATEPAKDQAYWSGRAKGLQSQLDRDQAFAVALQSQINALTTQYTNVSDPVQQAALANDRQKALDELTRVTKQVTDGKKAIVDLQEEARRAGVPSGWLR